MKTYPSSPKREREGERERKAKCFCQILASNRVNAAQTYRLYIVSNYNTV